MKSVFFILFAINLMKLSVSPAAPLVVQPSPNSDEQQRELSDEAMDWEFVSYVFILKFIRPLKLVIKNLEFFEFVKFLSCSKDKNYRFTQIQ